MAQNVDAMVREAIRAFKAGEKAKARAMLEEATDIDPHNEKAWMWLSAAVDSPEDQRICLENVLFINPENQNARKGLDYLAKQAPPPPAPTPPAEEIIDDGFPDTDQTTAFFEDIEPEPDPAAAPDSYAVPTSSASAAFDPNAAPSSDEYDDWVAGLNLGSSDANSPGTGAQPAFDFDDDLFADPFGSDEDDSVGTAPFTEDLFDDDDSMIDGPFDADALLDGFSAADLNYPEPLVEEEDELDSLLADLDEVPAQRQPNPAVMSPEPPAEEQAAAASRRQRRKRPAKPAVGPADDDFLLGGEDIDSSDPGEYFRIIPSTIKATRLPGVSSSSSRGVKIGLGVLAIANLGALGMLLLNMI